MLAVRIILIIAFFYQIEGFGINTPHCSFQCGNPKKVAAAEPDAKTPSAYYWRDFYGVIPPDALPLEVSTQSPKTYVGLTYDPKNKGYFMGTIHDGMNYIYIAKEGNITKIDKHIQILCTESTEKLGWFKLTQETYDKLAEAGNEVLNFGSHKNSTGSGVYQFIAKTTVNDVSYVGGGESFTKNLEYALKDGTYGSSSDFEWLMYNPNNITKMEDLEAKSRRPFFSKNFKYQFGRGSLIPKFHQHVSLGSCSLTCTNMNKQNNEEIVESNTELLSSLAYYWQMGKIADFTQAIPSGGIDFLSDKPSYIGQSPILGLNCLDVGSGNEQGSIIPYKSNAIRDSSFFRILSSNYQEKFKWVQTTSDDFPNLDKGALIPGGLYENGTETYVCRNVNRNNITTPGSARVLSTGTLCYSYLIVTKQFDVLMFQPENE